MEDLNIHIDVYMFISHIISKLVLYTAELLSIVKASSVFQNSRVHHLSKCYPLVYHLIIHVPSVVPALSQGLVW